MGFRERLMYDLVIIGGGPAGVSAALQAARCKLNLRVLTANVGSFSNLLEDALAYPRPSHISGYELVRAQAAEMERLGIVPAEGEEALSLEETRECFMVKTGKGVYESRALIVATGRRSRRLGIKGEKEFNGKGLSYCAMFDGEDFQGKTVAVIGGGHAGLLAASYLAKLAKKVYVIEKKPDVERTARVKEALRRIEASGRAEMLTGTKATEVLGDGVVHGLRLDQGGKERLLGVDGVFVEAGSVPNSGFLSEMVELNSEGEILIDKLNATSRRGLFAAGDVTDIPAKTIMVALGEGAKASFSAMRYLEENRLLVRK